MKMLPPQPAVQAFVTCREMWELADSGEVVLIGPFSRVTCPAFPADVPASVYAHLTDARGRYEIGLALIDSDGMLVWRWPRTAVVEEPDPLMPHRLMLRHIRVAFPQSGRYDLILLANGQPLAQHALWARHAGDATT